MRNNSNESQPSRPSTLVGASMTIKGQLFSAEEVWVNGEVEGTLESEHRLTIGSTGKVNASIKARELIVQGTVRGDVEVSGKVTIHTGATIVGDVKTAGIDIEDGAFFKGGIDIARPESVSATLSAQAAGRV